MIFWGGPLQTEPKHQIWCEKDKEIKYSFIMDNSNEAGTPSMLINDQSIEYNILYKVK